MNAFFYCGCWYIVERGTEAWGEGVCEVNCSKSECSEITRGVKYFVGNIFIGVRSGKWYWWSLEVWQRFVAAPVVTRTERLRKRTQSDWEFIMICHADCERLIGSSDESSSLATGGRFHFSMSLKLFNSQNTTQRPSISKWASTIAMLSSSPNYGHDGNKLWRICRCRPHSAMTKNIKRLFIFLCSVLFLASISPQSLKSDFS